MTHRWEFAGEDAAASAYHGRRMRAYLCGRCGARAVADSKPSKWWRDARGLNCAARAVAEVLES